MSKMKGKIKKAGLWSGMILVFILSVAAVKQIMSGVYDWNRLVPVKTHTGSVIQIMKGPTRSLEFFDVKAISMRSGKETHSYLLNKLCDELIIVKEGSAEISVNSIKKVLGEGSIVVASGGDRVIIRNPAVGNLVYYSFVFKPRESKTGRIPVSRIEPFFSSWDTITFRPNQNGGRRNIIQKPTSSLKQLEIHTTTLKEGLPSHAAHNHPDEEIILVRFGTVDQTLRGSHNTIGAGSLFFATNDDDHGISNAGQGSCEYYAIRWLTY